ncbi:MAG: alpha/beta hydrolase [Mycoplasmataceae bacterium]|nr:alpha/beta hydrolase [Mycoplasmataceae bacterium]
MEVLNNKIGSYKFKPAASESKGVIVFIHGFATNSDYHDSVAEKFVNYDYYAFELPGHGYTNIDSKNKININTLFVNFCLSMIKKLKLDNFFLIGHSMGGSIAMRIANKIKSKVQKLILVTPMNSSITLKTLSCFFIFNPKNFNKTLALNNVLYKDLTKTINLDVENYISNEHMYQVKHIKFFKKLKYKMFSLTNLKDCMKEERNLSTPTLLMVGEYDQTIPYKAAIRSIKRSNKPFIQVAIFTNSAHLPFKEEPEKYLKDVIDFIE